MIKPPTYHRQKLLLFLLEQAGGTLSKMDLHKLLFLYVKETEKNHYAFVPYRFGCYSFMAADDLDLLHKRGWLALEHKNVRLQTSLALLPWPQKSPERLEVRDWLATKTVRGAALIQEVYRRYPYYAINSEIKEQLLNDEELIQVQKAGRVVSSAGQAIYTIGYEGLRFEEYVNRLIRRGIKLLCDVRQNPLSRKFGFSKRTLATLLPEFGIAYLHLPELGIESESRKQLKSRSDYEALFTAYSNSLPKRQAGLAQVMEQLTRYNQIALTCFERESHNCHRHCISDFLTRQYQVKVFHL